MTTRRALAILLAGLSLTGAAYAWIAVPRLERGAGVGIAALLNNDFVATFSTTDVMSGGSGVDLGLVRVDAVTGETVWLHDPPLPGFEQPLGVAADTSGDIVLAGRGDAGNFVAKLWSTGDEAWRKPVVGTWGSGYADMPIAFDGLNNVIVGGAVQNLGTGADPMVEKLDAATGEILWRREWNNELFEYGKQVIVGSSGDVFLVAHRGVEYDTSIVIRRLSGVDGSDVWTSTIAPPPGEDVNAVSAALDGAGHLIVVGITYPFSGLDGAWLVAAVREADGAFLWNQAIEGRGARPDAYERTWSVAGASGSAYVIGALGSRSSGSEFAVVAINGATGAERWRYVPKGHGIAWGSGRAVASAADGSLVVTGSVSDSQGHQDMFIARLGADDGRAIWEQLPRLSAFPTRGLGSGIAFDSQGNIGVIGELDHPLVADAAPAIVKLRFTDGSFGVAQPPRPHRTKGTSEP